METFSACYTDRLGAAVRTAANEQCPEGYEIRPCSTDLKLLMEAVNQGIDAHLEAVFFRQEGRKLFFEPDTLHVLVRRLLEGEHTDDGEDGPSLASSICQSLGIELI